MSMAHGLEIRVPFLDNEVIKNAFQIPSTLKFEGNVQKQLLIDSFGELLPESIWNRPKMGFSFPFAEWLKNNELTKELYMSTNGYTQKALKNFSTDKLHWSRIMSLIVLKNKFPSVNI
jgi:asparagine synthase (glutamine-hydrolysing)